MTANLDRLARYFGGRRPPSRQSAGGTRLKVLSEDEALDVLSRPQSREERRKSKRIEVSEQRDRQWERYCAAREDRKRRLQDKEPGVRRFLKHLRRIEESGEIDAREKNDCDVDLAELAGRCGIDRLPSESDIFFVYELTSEWLRRLRQRQHNGKLPADTGLDFFKPGDPFAGTAIGELRALLKIH